MFFHGAVINLIKWHKNRGRQFPREWNVFLKLIWAVNCAVLVTVSVVRAGPGGGDPTTEVGSLSTALQATSYTSVLILSFIWAQLEILLGWSRTFFSILNSKNNFQSKYLRNEYLLKSFNNSVLTANILEICC